MKTRTTQDLPRRGRPPKLDKKSVKQLVNEINNKSGRSQCVAARKYNVCAKSIGNYLKRNGVNDFKKITAPLVK